MEWTTAGDIREQIERYWADGRLLTAGLAGRALYPLGVRFRKPGPRDLAERFDEVRSWIKELEGASKAAVGFGYEIQWAETNHHQLGRNRLPVRVTIPTEHDAVELVGKAEAARLFAGLVEQTLRLFPELHGWLVAHPLAVIEEAQHWPQILQVVAWLRDHPRSGLYVRQIDIPGIHTKFIETRALLLDGLLEVICPGRSGSTPEERFGLRSKVPLVRFRLLDEDLSVSGFSDLALPAPDFGRLALPVRHVFIAENEISGLIFPSIRGGMVIFGLGYGIERLGYADWLRDKRIHYWGDIDTHGFAMLDRVRAGLPQATSFLMDRETLVSHRELWVVEEEPYLRPLTRLTPAEQFLYDDLRYDRLGGKVRLEQERISLSRLQQEMRSVECDSP